MNERRDYYEILGVPRDADAAAIKRAFRALALRYHPDRSQEPDAEERFKEIAEAYAVLGDAQKRAEYDAHGFAGFEGMRPEEFFSGVDLEDLFGGLGFDFGGPGGGGLFERFFGGRRRGPARGSPIETEVEVPLATVATGGEHRVTVGHPRACGTCGGSGARPGTAPRACEPCRGTGQQMRTRQEGKVRMQTLTACPACGGRGRVIDEPCGTCGGSGRVADRETLSVRIPAGVRDGTILRVPGKGMPAPQAGGAPGDLLVAVRVRPDPRFTRRGAHLWREEEIRVADAVLGTRLTVPTLDGRAHLEVPPGTQPDTVLRLRGKGVPEIGRGARGDLHVVIRVRVPERVSRDERDLWERLRALAGGRRRS